MAKHPHFDHLQLNTPTRPPRTVSRKHHRQRNRRDESDKSGQASAIITLELLPTEIWILVFAAVSGYETSNTSMPTIMAISHVSRSWRRLTLDSPSLWTRIYIPLRPTFQHWPPSMLDLQLARSQSLPLDVTLDSKFSAKDEELYKTWFPYWMRKVPERYREALLQLAPHVSRFRSLVVNLTQRHVSTLPLTEDHLILLDMSVPHTICESWQALDNLVEVSLVRQDPSDVHFGGITMVWPIHTTRLRFLRVHHIHVQWAPGALAGLCDLDLRGPVFGENWLESCMTHLELSTALGPAPALQRLSLAPLAVDVQGMDLGAEAGRLSLPHLRALRLDGTSHTTRILGFLDAPEIRSVAVEDSRATATVAEFLKFVAEDREWRFARVEQLWLASIHSVPGIHEGFVAALPTLCCAAFYGPVTAHVRRALVELHMQTGSTVAWPCLRTLALSMLFLGDSPEAAADYVRGMVETRASAGSPLSELKLLDEDGSRTSWELVDSLGALLSYHSISAPDPD
jgi:hypothetical protein